MSRHFITYIRPAFVTVVALALVVLSVGRGDQVSDLRRVAGAYEQDLVRWEVTHFMDKWFDRLGDLFGGPSEAERLEAATSFFDLRDDLSAASGALEQTLAAADSSDAATAARSVEEIERQRDELQGVVEETLEGAISEAAARLGIIDSIGPLKWPPVDFTFEERGLVLVRSPRDRIERLDDLLLDPGVPILEQVRLEEEIDAIDPDVVSLVVRIGGVATYPSQVSPTRSLHGTLEIAAHEWLHHWLIFRPLGRKWFAGGELQSINETVANIAAQEIGDLALEILTGQVIVREPWAPPEVREREEPPPDVFDFRREMRETRTELERLLGAGDVAGAEVYLEERRLEFVANGYNIRKLNTAWFAFNGTYADSPASISPIEPQLRTLRAASPTLADFLDAIAGISREGELETLATEAGWTPAQ